MFKLKIADVVFGVIPNYKACKSFCEKFLYEGDKEPEFIIKIEKSDIEREQNLAGEESFSQPYLETLALNRLLAERFLRNYNAMLFHCSAIKYKNGAYLFTAPSGTGKSTHVSYWKRLLGEKAVIINDDKPIIRKIDNKFYVYGSPWNGKHNLGENVRAELKAVCTLTRAKENYITEISAIESVKTIMGQTLRPSETENVIKLINLVEGVATCCPQYKLGCNLSPESAKVSFSAMTGENL